MNTKSNTAQRPRQSPFSHEHIHDPYKTRRKLPEPTLCPECGAVFHQGRWQWASFHPYDAHQATCQACHRIKDNYPAGVITLSGDFVQKHKADLLRLARNHEAEEKKEHPLNRIMGVEERPEAITIKTTDIHLPRRIGEALHHAYKGDLELQYPKRSEGSYFIRVNWNREK